SNNISSDTKNAAHLLAILAWLLLFIISTIVASVLVVNYMGQEPEQSTPLFWATICAIFILSFIILITASGLKKHRQWSRYVGGFLAIAALFAFPVGTVMGLFILNNIHKGWDEH
ncbi:MAG: hypothetical protein ACKE5Q_03775, partial [Methylophilaceae bacterium]